MQVMCYPGERIGTMMSARDVCVICDEKGNKDAPESETEMGRNGHDGGNGPGLIHGGHA